MTTHLRILVVEDSEDDMLLMLRELRRGGYALDCVRVETPAEMQAALDLQSWDLVIADYTLPAFSAPEALKLLQRHQQDIPFIIVSGTIGEETAVTAMKAGAHDYLTKSNLTRLVPAVERELREAEERRKRHRAEQALRESEERFRQLAENIIESVFWISDPRVPQVLYVSPTYERIWGQPCEGLYHNFMEWLAPIHPEEQQRLASLFLGQALVDTYDEEYRLVRADGSLRWIRDRGFPIRDPQGQPYRVVGIAEDITDRKMAEAALRRAQRMESLGTLASGIAHDFNNILTPILVTVQLLLLKLPNLDERNQQLLRMVEDSAKRGADLVKQILAFARGVEGKQLPLQVKHLLLEMAQVARQTFPKTIDIKTRLPAIDLALVAADATQMHQVLMNLCVNARDAMPSGGCLTLSADHEFIDEVYTWMNLEARAGAYVVITVADTGMGIQPDLLERIFDPFFTTKEVGKGTGLGLSTVLGIVKNHKGFIKVHSEMGQGSQFKVYLPAIAGAAPPPRDDLALLGGHNELILVVEDEPLIQQVTQTSLENYNYRTLMASEGREAIALYAKHQQDISVVLMDIMMPSMDGLSAIGALRKLNPQVKVIAMSGLASNRHLATTAGTQIDAFLTKPYTVKGLLNTLQKVLSDGPC